LKFILINNIFRGQFDNKKDKKLYMRSFDKQIMNIKNRLLIAGCLVQFFVLTGCQRIASDSQKVLKPAYQSYIAGYSVQNRPIECFVLGSGEDVIFIKGAIHGDEPASATLANAMLKYLKSNPHLLNGRKVILLPVVNPDGLAAKTRFNARGVDLNRNFEAVNRIDKSEYGMFGLSEPESVIIKELLHKYKPDKIVSLHQPLACIDYDGPAIDIAMKMSRYCDLEVKKLGARPGSFGSYAGITLGIPTITVEMYDSDTSLSEDQVWQRYGKMMLAAMMYPEDIKRL
jgi:murein peptide amidase A